MSKTTVDPENIYKVRKKYPDKVPMLVFKAARSRLNDLPRKKYLVPCSMTLGSFSHYIRQNIHLKKDQALFLYIQNSLHSNSITLGQLYKQYKNEKTLVLEIQYDTESVFG